MFRWKATAAVAVAAAAALVLTACSGGSDSGSGEDGTLTLTAIVAPTSYNPAEGGEWGNRSPYFQAVYDSLLSQDDNGDLQPWLATEWSYNDDNTVLTLTLRDDVTFSDGTALTADAAKQSLEHFRDGTAPNAAHLAGVTVAAPDDTTLVLTLTAPDPALLTYLSQEAGIVAAPSTWENENAATEPVGSGPYVLDTASTVTGTSYVYTANEDYWNADAVHYSALDINVISDATAAVNAIKAGEANGVKLPDNSTITEVEASGWTVESNELDFQGLLLFDRDGTMNEALGDVRVRQAINYAFDRDALLQATQQGYGTVTEQIFPVSSAAYDESLDSTYSYDPEKAKELLAEAGYPDGFTLSMPSVSSYQTTFDLVAQQLADVGITVEYTDTVIGDFIADMLAPKYAASWMQLQQDPDWALINFMIDPDATWNPFHTEDETVDALIETVQYGTTEESDTALQELNAYLVDQAWFAPFYRVQGSFATDANTTVTVWPTNAYPSLFAFEPTA